MSTCDKQSILNLANDLADARCRLDATGKDSYPFRHIAGIFRGLPRRCAKVVIWY